MTGQSEMERAPLADEVREWAQQWELRKHALYAASTAARFQRAADAMEDLERRLAASERSLESGMDLYVTWAKRALAAEKALEFYAKPEHWLDPTDCSDMAVLQAMEGSQGRGWSVAAAALAGRPFVDGLGQDAFLPESGDRGEIAMGDEGTRVIEGATGTAPIEDEAGRRSHFIGAVECEDESGVLREYTVIQDCRVHGATMLDRQVIMLLDLHTMDGVKRLALAGWAVPIFQDQLRTATETTELKVGQAGTA